MSHLGERELEDHEEKYLDLLNLLCGYWDFSVTHARKDHIDEFGDTIEGGDYYVSRKYNPGYHNTFKISLKNMRAIIRILFWGNETIKQICNKLEQVKNQQLIEASNMVQSSLEKDT